VTSRTNRILAVLLIANAVLVLLTLGWLTWITLEPRYWFPAAYAEKGESAAIEDHVGRLDRQAPWDPSARMRQTRLPRSRGSLLTCSPDSTSLSPV
jgi:hypothetical protein